MPRGGYNWSEGRFRDSG